jgi:hypothetical protein
MAKRRDGAPIVVVDRYRPRLSADFGEAVRFRVAAAPI